MTLKTCQHLIQYQYYIINGLLIKVTFLKKKKLKFKKYSQKPSKTWVNSKRKASEKKMS